MSSNTVTGVVQNIVIKGPQEDGKDEGFVNKIKSIFNDLGDSMKNKEYAFDVFEKNLLFLKSFGLAFLIILAVVNYVYYKNTGLISQKPMLFFVESCVFGLSGVIPFLILCFFRNDRHFSKAQIFNASIAIFLVFFALNYLLELSGIYPAIFQSDSSNDTNSNDTNTNDTNDDSKKSNFEKLKISLGTSSDIVLLIIFAVSVFSLFFATAFVRDTSPDYVQLQSISPSFSFIIEMLLFGIVSAVPIFFMASNRGVLSSNTTKEFLLIVVKFSVLHCLLQLSGFYRYLFTGSV